MKHIGEKDNYKYNNYYYFMPKIHLWCLIVEKQFMQILAASTIGCMDVLSYF